MRTDVSAHAPDSLHAPIAPVAPTAALDSRTARFGRILATQLAYGMGFSTFAIVPAMLARRGDSGSADIGLLSATLAFGALLTAPVAGFALDRFGRVRVLRAGIVSTVIALLGLAALVDSPSGRLFASFVGGASFVFVFNGTSTLAADAAKPGELARAVGWLGSAGMIAHAAAPAIAERLAPHVGWRAVFLLAAGVCSLSLVVSRGLLDPPGLGRARSWAQAGEAMRAIGPLLGVALCAGGGYAAIYTFHQPHLVSLGAERVGAYFVGFTGGALVMRLGFGGLPDRLGHARTTALSLGLYVLVCAGFTWVSEASLGLFGALHGVAHGVFYPACTALVLSRVSTEARGFASALANGAFNAGHAVASLGYGALAAREGTGPVFLAGAGVLLVSLPLLALAAHRGTSTE